MIRKLREYFEEHLQAGDGADRRPDEHRLRLACAALMLEMVHADHEADVPELQRLEQILQEKFEIDEDEAADLIRLAAEERRHATDYYQFTTLINAYYSQQQKRELVYRLWQVALADRSIHKLEEHLVRRLADLLHVPHAAFMQGKHRALE